MRVLEPCALLSQGLHDPILAAQGKVLGVRWGGLKEGDPVTVTEQLWGARCWSWGEREKPVEVDIASL